MVPASICNNGLTVSDNTLDKVAILLVSTKTKVNEHNREADWQ